MLIVSKAPTRDNLGRFTKGSHAGIKSEFKKGNSGYWLGKKRSVEDCRSISLGHMGNTPWNKNKRGVMPVAWNKGKTFDYVPHYGMRSKMCGQKNPAWRGGKVSEAKKIRNMAVYKEWRLRVFERDGYKCQKCGHVGGDLQADHIMPFAYYPTLRFELDNGRTLCNICHRKTDTYSWRCKC